MKEEKPKDRARYTLSVILVLFANFILIPAALFLSVLTVVTVFDKEFPLAALFFALAILCVFFNRLILKADDRYEAKRVKEQEEYRLSQIKKITVDAKCSRSGKLEFAYDPEEETMTASGNQLRPFNNAFCFDVVSYDTEGKLSYEVSIIDKIFKDEEVLLNGMLEALSKLYQKEGVDEKNLSVRSIKITELDIEKEKAGYYVELRGEHENRYGIAKVKAKAKNGSNDYKFSSYWE